MQRVPRLRIDGEKIGSRAQIGKLVASEIIGACASDSVNQAHASALVLAIQSDGGPADRIPHLIQHVTGKHGLRGQAKDKMFGVGVAAGDDGSGKILMLLERRLNEPAPRR